MPSATMRGFLGFIAGAIAVLTFHQGMVELLHVLGVVQFAPYRTTPVPPFGVPVIVSNCFWGGLWGVLFGLVMPRFTWPTWLCGLLLGVTRSDGRMVCRRTAEGHTDRRRLGSGEHAAFGGDQRVLGARRRHHPANADAALVVARAHS